MHRQIEYYSIMAALNRYLIGVTLYLEKMENLQWIYSVPIKTGILFRIMLV
nr:MAG TPA: hypothetical protein [Crassvirales sp.]